MKKKLIIFAISIIICIFGAVGILLYQLSSLTGHSFLYFPSLVLRTLSRPQPNPSLNFLILGMDYRDDLLEKTQTTDTIILARLNSSDLSLISLPRDLWSYPLGQKINQIYPLSRQSADPFVYIKSQFKPIVGREIDRVTILSIDSLIELTKIIGGVDLYLEKGFKDEFYPNPEYIKNPSPEIPKYQTIEFPSGQIHLDESNITQFVRSRKSAETSVEGGTDLGRIHRQQLLIDALLTKIRSRSFVSHPSNLIGLYDFYRQRIETDLEDQDLISLLFTYRRKLLNLSFKRFEIPINNRPADGPIYDPEKLVQHQWAFLPSDPSYQKLHDFINNSLQ